MQFCVYNFRIHEIVCIWRKASGSDGSSSQGSKKNETEIHTSICSWSNKRSQTLKWWSEKGHPSNTKFEWCTRCFGWQHTYRKRRRKKTPNCTCAYLIYICSTRSLYLLLALFSIHGDWINWVHVWFIVQTYVERFKYIAGDQEQTATKNGTRNNSNKRWMQM